VGGLFSRSFFSFSFAPPVSIIGNGLYPFSGAGGTTGEAVAMPLSVPAVGG